LIQFDLIHWLWHRSKRAGDGGGRQLRTLNFYECRKIVKDFLLRKCLSKNAKFGAENLYFREMLEKKFNVEHP